MKYKFRVFFENEMHYDDLGSFVGIDGMEICEVHGKLMQFTGLLDKHGKEIYEGDILKTDSGKAYIVSYNKDWTAFVLTNINSGLILRLGAQPVDLIASIIGNIHKNHELN